MIRSSSGMRKPLQHTSSKSISLRLQILRNLPNSRLIKLGLQALPRLSQHRVLQLRLNVIDHLVGYLLGLAFEVRVCDAIALSTSYGLDLDLRDLLALSKFVREIFPDLVALLAKVLQLLKG